MANGLLQRAELFGGQCAEQNWRRLRGFEDLNKVITGVKFNDGVEIKQSAA